ncbi:hypothetical protein EYF80_053692 [Liparis tanakae]|uniref:Uncharacterized protein n=1 Tax=Liparis tanakae TaxID=230148 RepID=A0A4Z2F5N7_9TELE|nr:hypothetical protein EYF80_053692 [Liparis tanakae]
MSPAVLTVEKSSAPLRSAVRPQPGALSKKCSWLEEVGETGRGKGMKTSKERLKRARWISEIHYKGSGDLSVTEDVTGEGLKTVKYIEVIEAKKYTI